MILTEQEISLLAHNIDDGDWNDLNYQKCWHEGFVAGARAIESAVLKKLKAQEPFAFHHDEEGLSYSNHYTGTVPLYRHPLPPDDVVRDPRVAELEAVLRECREVLVHCAGVFDEVRGYPITYDLTIEAITKIYEVLSK